MGILNRVYNIVRTSFINSDSGDNNFELDWLDNDDDLKIQIENLCKEPLDYKTKIQSNTSLFPDNIKNAFKTLGISETNELNVINTAFKNRIKQIHPDTNPNISETERKQLFEKTTKLINDYQLIKKFLTNS